MQFRVKSKFNPINLLPLLVLCFCLGGSYYLCDLVYHLEQKEHQQRFEFRANEIEFLIKQRLKAYAQVLYGGRALFNASQHVSRSEFKDYVASLRIESFYPGIQGLGFSQLISASDKQNHITAIQKQGFPDYDICPQGLRQLYSSIIYLEPFSNRNLRAFGYDMYSDSVRHKAMDIAWLENDAAVSDNVKLVQEDGKNVQAGFLMYLPVYRKNVDISTPLLRRSQLLGWIYAPFRIGDFMQPVLEKENNSQLAISVDIYDGKKMSPEALFYSHEKKITAQTKPLYVSLKVITLFRHFWLLYIHSQPDFEKHDLTRFYLTVPCSLMISIMLTMITQLLVNGRMRATLLAQQMSVDLQEKETRYRQMFEGISSIAVLIDPENGNIVDANPAASSFWGYSVEKLRTMNISDINPWPLNSILPILATALKKQQHMVAQHHLSDGQIKDVEFYSNGISYQGRQVVYALVHDITERKQQEKEIKRLSDSELNKAKLAAENANKAKSEFLSSMSHELRTPMNAVLGFAQLLELEELTEDQLESVKYILTAGRHLLDLINDVLDLAKIEADKLDLTLEQLDLKTVVKQSLALTLNLAAKNDIKIVNQIGIDCHSTVIADSLRLKQILLNLITNAIKYNRVGGSVTLSCELINPQMKRISITDTGNGLSEEQISKLFQPFERLSAKNSNIEGTGIGLCICKKLIEAMNGRIGVESTEGEGSCFWIEIPLA